MVHWQVIYDPPLPLAGYRELAAHVIQIEGVSAELFAPTSTTFSYTASQIGGINLHLPETLMADQQQILEAILDYYGSFQRQIT